MNPENQNQPDDQSSVKLVFDIMPQGGSAPAPERPQAPWPNAPQPVSGRPAPMPKKPGIMSSDHPDKKWIVISLSVVALASIGAAIYFIFFQGPKIPPMPVGQQNNEPALKTAWLKKYFGSETCNNESVCGPNADADSDGMRNLKEADKGTSPVNADTDYDGLSDTDEIQIYSTDPLNLDSDGDGFEDGSEVRGGFSPILATAEPMAPLEAQSIESNITSFGQHEPTIAFLSTQNFKTRFNNNSTSTPQVSLSVPKDWKIVTEGNLVKISSAEDSLRFSLAIMPSGTTLDQANQSYSDAVKLLANYKVIMSGSLTVYRLNSFVNEVTFSAGEKTIHEKVQLIEKEGQVFDVRFSTPEADWQANKSLADVVLNSVR